MKRLRMSFAIFLSVIAFNACQKDDSSSVADEVAVSQQETQTEEALADVDMLTDEAVDLYTSSLKSATIQEFAYLNDCPAITVDKNSNPQTLTIDFGASCTGKDEKVRSGKIVVTSTAFNTFPSVRDFTFDNYTVDGKKIEGSLTKNISKDQKNNVRTAVISENITITFPDNEGKATRVANITRQYQRNKLLNPLDNQIVSWGTTEFTKVSGAKLTKTVTSDKPLVFKISCHHLVSGVETIINDKRTWIIDYGEGSCDNKAILTEDGKSKEIRIR